MKVEVKNLSKRYKNKYALKRVSFTLEGPKIYGLLGRNGAGKTTFMDVLAGNIFKTEGDILINGKDPQANEVLANSICLIKEGDNFDKELKIQELLQFYSYFYPNWDMDLAEQLIKEYHLDPKVKIKSLSKGMESALSITVGLASKAEITVFDEPYIGLDAAGRKMFYKQLLEEYENYPRMIIFSTHLIDEVSLLFEEILILREGELILQEEAESLREQTYAVSGSLEDIESFIQDKKVIHKQQLAGTMQAYVYGEEQEAQSLGFHTEGVPIQELMIYLTEKEGA